MLELLQACLRHGFRTVALPVTVDAFPDRFRGRPALDPAKCIDSCRVCVDVCPTGAISAPAPLSSPLSSVTPCLRGESSLSLSLDLGKCLFCPACVEACPTGAITVTRDHRLAARTRDDLRITSAEAPKLAALDDAMRKLFGRALRLRQVSAGGCNGCEAELVAVGACAISQGVFASADGPVAGIPREIPVDLFIPGCPPHPLTVLDGLLGLLGRSS